MEEYVLLLMALGVSMDAFAVSIGKGLALKRASFRDAIIIALWFGIFHAMMPIIGYYIGETVIDYIEKFAHWVIFAILVYLGGMLIRDAIKDVGHTEDKETGISSMLPLSIAVSIDSLAVGIGLAAEEVSIIVGALNLGIVTGLMSFGGVFLGNRIGTRYGRVATFAGGAILVVIGSMAVIEHYFM